MGRKENWTWIQSFQIESFAVNFIFIDIGEDRDTGFFKVPHQTPHLRQEYGIPAPRKEKTCAKDMAYLHEGRN